MDLDFQKRGTIKYVIITDVELVAINTVIVCEAHKVFHHYRGSGVYPLKF